MFRPNPPARPRPVRPISRESATITVYKRVFQFPAADYVFVRPGVAGPEGILVDEVSVPLPPPTPVDNTEEETARVFFPESWIFQLLKAE